MKTIEQATEIFLSEKRVRDFVFSHIFSDTTNTDHCWKWIGASSGGHPMCAVRRKVVRVRGLLYRALLRKNPKINPTNLCGNNSCVNPWHCGEEVRRDKSFASVDIAPTRLFPSSEVYQCKKGHPVVGPNRLPRGNCRICAYISIERCNDAQYGRAIRKIEKQLEELAGNKSHDWNPRYRGKIGKRGQLLNA